MNYSEPTYTPRDYPSTPSPTKKITSTTLSDKNNKKPIIYKEFERASMHTEDPEWEDLLLLAARGGFNGKRVLYDGTYLMKKDTAIKVKMPEDPKELAECFINFHRKHDDLFTRTDVKNQCDQRKKTIEEIVEIKSWSDCSKGTKKALLIEYANRMTESYHGDLGGENTNDLLCVLLLADSLGLLNPSTIKIADNKIKKLDSVVYSEKSKKWCLNIVDVPTVGKPSSKKTTSKHEIKEGWDSVSKRHTELMESVGRNKRIVKKKGSPR